MLFTHHPDVTGSLAAERTASLLADAEEHRRSRRRAAQWRPARFRQPTPDLQRVTIPHTAAADRAGRAA
jgi:hypothetical protein